MAEINMHEPIILRRYELQFLHDALRRVAASLIADPTSEAVPNAIGVTTGLSHVVSDLMVAGAARRIV